jgi:DNA (cytosine-5)-methyltransferase 1
MAETRAVPSNGYRVVSTFTGCGGSCLGFRLAGYSTIWASEFVDVARDCYRLNFPDVPIDPRDIRTVQPSEILKAIGLEAGAIDVLEGSPPCASFSTAGKRQKHWGKTKRYSETEQRSDDLFFEYVRVLEGLQPRVFVAENVRGLAIGRAKGYYLEIKERLAGAGYRVAARVVDAQWLGVPQRRARVVFLGVRNDLEREPAFPTPRPYRYSVRDALPEVAATSRRRGKLRPSHQPAPTIVTHWRGFYQMRAIDEHKRPGSGASLPGDAGPEALSIERFAIADEARRLKPGGVSRKYLNLIRADSHAPCPTITQAGGNLGAAGVVHPSAARKFTIDELRALFGFPADFALVGSYAQQWERLGRSVPPPMMQAIAETIRDEILAPADAQAPRRRRRR